MPRVEKGAGGGGKKRAAGSKKEKDPNVPKRAQSAYMIWLGENRAKLTKPGMGVTDVAKAAGAEWRKMTDKTKWEQKAGEEKKRYEQDMTAYKAGTFVPKPVEPKGTKKAEPVAKKQRTKNDDDDEDDGEEEAEDSSPSSPE